ncbi:MAG: PAS-domain containing protein [Rhodospirillaceae bacterium]|nr:PAS-domain containing protein [Rhodospirillaceae bacterium]
MLAAAVICFLASFTAFSLIARSAEAAVGVRIWWKVAASFAVGSGIWATHFIAMLAYSTDIPHRFNAPLTLASILVAILLAGLGIELFVRPGRHMQRIGGATIGLGIGAMHYIGMAAWKIQGTIAYDTDYVMASLLFGIVGGGLATWIASTRTGINSRLTAATMLTLAICAMHFTGITAMSFTYDPTMPVPPALVSPDVLAVAVSTVILLILSLCLGGAILDDQLASRAARQAAREMANLKAEIEQRKAAQVELQHHRDNLERDVALRTAALAASEARLADAIETLPEAFVLFDAADRLVVCNAAYRALSETTTLYAKPGVTYEELIDFAVKLGDHDLEGQDTVLWMKARIAQRRAVGSEPVRSEQTRPDGRSFEIHERRMADGGLVTIQTDVTETRRRISLVAERDKLAALGQLAGGVAHEINNLLQPALTLPELVRDSVPADDLDAQEFLDVIVDSVKKARDIVRKILLFARKEEASLQTADLVAEVVATLKFIRDLLPPGIELRPRFGADEQMAVFNKTELTQVLSNLIINAAHATGDKGTIDIELGQALLSADQIRTLGLRRDVPYATVSITDKGSGMNKATQMRIFEPFFTTKPLGVGTGLGLSVVLGILRSWNGAIAVDSMLGYGTTFTLYIPLREMPAAESTTIPEVAQLAR